MITLTYYLEIVSSWCHWAEPAWRILRERFPHEIEFHWKIALMPPEGFPRDRDRCDRFYCRSGTVAGSPYMLHSGWLDPALQGDYSAPDLVAEGGRALGITDDRIRLALAHAALREGRPVGRLEESVALGAAASGLRPADLHAAALDPATRAALDASTAEFYSFQIDQRPAFVLTSEIGDRAIFSGIFRAVPLIATIEAMLADVRAYRSFHAHFGQP